jgi:lysozyme
MNGKQASGAGVLSLVVLMAAWFITPHEGTVPVAYRDVAQVVTACTGHTEPGLQVGTDYSASCARWLASDIGKAATGVQACVRAPMTSYQWAAYTSLAFNIGVPAFCRSSIARKANAGDIAGACAAIELYVYAGGKRVQGLANRRAAERALCEGKV